MSGSNETEKKSRNSRGDKMLQPVSMNPDGNSLPAFIGQVSNAVGELIGHQDPQLVLRALQDVQAIISSTMQIVEHKVTWAEANGETLPALAPRVDLGNQSKRAISLARSYVILSVLRKGSQEPVGVPEIGRALSNVGLELERASLSTKLNRWKSPELYSQSQKPAHEAYVEWIETENRRLTSAGEKKLDKISRALAPDVKSYIDSVLDR